MAFFAAFLVSCQPQVPAVSHSTASTDEAVLKDTTGWKVDTLSAGMKRYNYSGYYQPYTSAQVVNVLEVDMASGQYELVIGNVFQEDSLSAVAEATANALAGINGTYYELVENGQSSSFLKADHEIKTAATIPKGHQLYWKHEGAFYYDAGTMQMGIAYGDNATYTQMPYANVISGSPMLIYNYEPVGESFVKPQEKPLEELPYEDPNRHQGVRHSRTGIATVGKNRVLLITVDGRQAEHAVGMSARELTQFVRKYFNPGFALNLDGGGSTTLWLKEEGVVNYPTDNKRFDHYGQRRLRNYVLLTSKVDRCSPSSFSQ